LRKRFWAEAALALASTSLLAVTLVWHDWIELVFGVDPDHQNGSAEWVAVIICACLAVVTSAAAWREWRPATALRTAPEPP
jgi:hypothetical protein